MEQEVLDALNKLIREEKGNRVTLDSTWAEADLDSFGTVVVLSELDSTYGLFADVPDGEDQFKTLAFSTLTVRDVVEKCMS